jgi:hypothetical protein
MQKLTVVVLAIAFAGTASAAGWRGSNGPVRRPGA